MAQSVSDRVELNEKESVGMTLSRFSPVKPKSEDANALLRYPMLRLVRQDEPTKPSIPYAERTFTERKAQHAVPNQVGDIMRAAAGRELWGNVTYSNAWESYDYRGFYTFDTSVNPLQMQMLGTNGSFYMEGNGGAVFQDGILYVVRYATYGSYFFIYINTYDPETFVQMGSTSTEDVDLCCSRDRHQSSNGQNVRRVLQQRCDGLCSWNSRLHHHDSQGFRRSGAPLRCIGRDQGRRDLWCGNRWQPLSHRPEHLRGDPDRQHWRGASAERRRPLRPKW